VTELYESRSSWESFRVGRRLDRSPQVVCLRDSFSTVAVPDFVNDLPDWVVNGNGIRMFTGDSHGGRPGSLQYDLDTVRCLGQKNGY